MEDLSAGSSGHGGNVALGMPLSQGKGENSVASVFLAPSISHGDSHSPAQPQPACVVEQREAGGMHVKTGRSRTGTVHHWHKHMKEAFLVPSLSMQILSLRFKYSQRAK